MNVQHWLDEQRPGEPHRTYDSLICKACTRIHFINRTTGELLGGDNKQG